MNDFDIKAAAESLGFRTPVVVDCPGFKLTETERV